MKKKYFKVDIKALPSKLGKTIFVECDQQWDTLDSEINYEDYIKDRLFLENTVAIVYWVEEVKEKPDQIDFSL